MNPADDAARSTRLGVEVVKPPAAEGLRPGELVAGYRIERQIGRGGMGVVYRAEHVHLGRVVALKVLAPHLAADPGFRERFVRESRIAASLHHPNVVTVHDAGEAGELVYLAMQLVEGPDLATVLADGPMDSAAAVDVLSQIASALDRAHAAGLVHRDVKPGNILLDNGHAYLTDFGLTKQISSASATTGAGLVVGTTDYLAPEQVEGRPLDARTDVYALACVLHFCLVGRPPFVRDSDVAIMYAHAHSPPPSLHESRPDLPAALDAALARGLAKLPTARPASCSELMAEARAALGGGAEADAVAPTHVRVLVAAPPAVAALVRASLGSGEFAVAEVPQDASPVEVARREAPDALLVDVRPGGGRGAETFSALRALPETSTIALVPRGHDALGRAMVDAGATHWLATPFSALQLKVAVGKSLRGES